MDYTVDPATERANAVIKGISKSFKGSYVTLKVGGRQVSSEARWTNPLRGEELLGWVVKKGPEYKGEVEYMILYSELRESTFVVARDVKRYNKLYRRTSTKYVVSKKLIAPKDVKYVKHDSFQCSYAKRVFSSIALYEGFTTRQTPGRYYTMFAQSASYSCGTIDINPVSNSKVQFLQAERKGILPIRIRSFATFSKGYEYDVRLLKGVRISRYIPLSVVEGGQLSYYIAISKDLSFARAYSRSRTRFDKKLRLKMLKYFNTQLGVRVKSTSHKNCKYAKSPFMAVVEKDY
eukprot:CAMPEP_0198736342 /NCGR_PEP_ID=MMETSP1475-20131203/65143_1 /TAXON_ID= ORGANISM="Unidentified sp., Strain CCMP1999" /NCGR_SAMPLE_ID=MMETSP1475 /ASSEMBLY_ACC=CAM_ASM_001111 /LENGTH=290 /DNA_ID=CAMNT_0044500133 /DNA_START=264 /DNA_END=1136 /DNA_ORIENTATION=+